MELSNQEMTNAKFLIYYRILRKKISKKNLKTVLPRDPMVQSVFKMMLQERRNRQIKSITTTLFTCLQIILQKLQILTTFLTSCS